MIMKLTYTKVKFHPKVKFQTGLSSLWVSCKHALRNLEIVNLTKSKSISVFREKILNFIRPSPNSVFDIHNPKGIKLITRLRLGLSHLREHKFKHSFQDTLNPLCNCGQVLSPLLVFSSIVPSLLMKDALSSALYVVLIVNYWILPITISHKRYFLATHPKLQAIISKSLTQRWIISYRVRDLTNHFFK